MATISGTQRYWKVELTVNETSTSIENNTSTAYWELWVKRTDSGSYPIMGTPTINIYISGQLAHSSSDYRNEQNITSAGRLWLSGTLTGIPHNADGTIVSNEISFSWTGVDFSPNNVSASGVYSTATIPRASEISSMSNIYVGENATINVNRKSNSFTHTITYSFGSLSDTIVTKSSNTGVSWAIPESFYTQMSNTTQKNVTLYITTYNGNSQVGDRKSSTFTLRTRESVCKPDIDATIKDINENTLALTGNELHFINRYSTIEATYEATAKKSASISSVKVNNNTVQTNPYEFTATAISEAINVTAYDSRGYSNTKEFFTGTDYTFISYVPLSSNVTVRRKSPTSDELLISFSGNYFNDTFGKVNNELLLKWKYREYSNNPTDWNDIEAQTLVLGTDYVLKENTYHSGDNSDYEEGISLGDSFDYRKNYEVQFIYSDKLENKDVVVLGTKGKPIVNWNGNYFKVNGDLKVTDNVLLELYAPYDYTQEDVNKVYNYIRGTEQLTPQEIKKYDVNKDGELSYLDYVTIYNFVQDGITTTNSYKLKLRNGQRTSDMAFILEDANSNEVAKINRSGYYFNNIPISNNSFYSANEMKIGQWIDGKPLYRKVIDFTDNVANDTTYSHNIDNVDLIWVSKAFAWNISANISWQIPTNLYGGIGTNNVDRMNIFVTRDYIGFKCDTTWGTHWRKVIVLEYTKTTD